MLKHRKQNAGSGLVGIQITTKIYMQLIVSAPRPIPPKIFTKKFTEDFSRHLAHRQTDRETNK